MERRGGGQVRGLALPEVAGGREWVSVSEVGRHKACPYRRLQGGREWVSVREVGRCEACPYRRL